jgi:membrane protein YqaA with SNARE-associated domain
VVDTLLGTLGLYGGTFVVAFVSGLFPLVSIELFLFGVGALAGSSTSLPTLVVLAAVGHQLAKTIMYYAGVGLLDRPSSKLAARVAALRTRIERWNRRPLLILTLAGAFGLPPMWLIGFIARPVMRIRFVPFTAITFVTRLVRFGTIAAVGWLA